MKRQLRVMMRLFSLLFVQYLPGLCVIPRTDFRDGECPKFPKTLWVLDHRTHNDSAVTHRWADSRALRSVPGRLPSSLSASREGV